MSFDQTLAAGTRVHQIKRVTSKSMKAVHCRKIMLLINKSQQNYAAITPKWCQRWAWARRHPNLGAINLSKQIKTGNAINTKKKADRPLSTNKFLRLAKQSNQNRRRCMRERRRHVASKATQATHLKLASLALIQSVYFDHYILGMRYV